MSFNPIIPKIVVIILNYRNWQDTIECLESVQQIDYPDYQIIVVDNGSNNESVEKIKEWADGNIKIESEYVKYKPDLKPLFYIEYDKETAESGGIRKQEDELRKYPPNRKIVIIQTGKNLGFSAGNNVGIRYAIKQNIDAVLIMNPDVRILDNQVLKKMVEVMFSNDNIYLVGPNVIDAEGNSQSPLREPSFLEECIYPFIMPAIRRLGMRPKYYIQFKYQSEPFEVEKIAACCMLLRNSFLNGIGLLDENTFLYCEEAILGILAKKNHGKIFFIPFKTVKHLHKRGGNKNLEIFFKSRLYFLKVYRKYTTIQLNIISVTHKIIKRFARRR